MIDSSVVNEIFRDCLFKKDEIEDGKPIYEPIKVMGIRSNYGFNPCKIEKYKKEINIILDDMDETFEHGWSFLNLCFDKNSMQWTGYHGDMEELMCLGLAIGRVKYCSTDKKLWEIMPGGMPYIMIKKIK